MATAVIMPRDGQSVESCIITEWKVKKGDAVKVGDILYEFDADSDTAMIVGYEGSPETVDVATVEYQQVNYTVTKVVDSAFKGCASLKSIVLPNVTSVEKNAFNGCSELADVSLAKATSIGDGVFSGCTKLALVSLPSLASVGRYAFDNCGSLVGIALTNVTSVGEGAFRNCSSLAKMSVTKQMKQTLEGNRSRYGIGNNVK